MCIIHANIIDFVCIKLKTKTKTTLYFISQTCQNNYFIILLQISIMKLIFYRKPSVYLFYLLVLLLSEYIFLKLFFDNQCKPDDRIDELKLELETLKQSKNKCDNSSLQDKLARFSKAGNECEGDNVGETFIRDFYRYDCKNIVRYGGAGADKTKRIDGAYYMCEDGDLKPKHSNCIVLSFGIYNNDMFDEAVNSLLNCVVHSMDPFNEPNRVSEIRDSNSSLKDLVTIKINENWKFHSLGITNGERIRDVKKKGWLDTYENILDYLQLNDKVIDVFKIDVEGAEWESIPFIMSTKPELLCKYVKQMAIETHSWLYTHPSNFKVIKSLEACFRLYKRDQRFYMASGEDTEWQQKDFNLPLNQFKDEVDLARFLFLYGELYFINKNFL
jgi:hypothetical protein